MKHAREHPGKKQSRTSRGVVAANVACCSTTISYQVLYRDLQGGGFSSYTTHNTRKEQKRLLALCLTDLVVAEKSIIGIMFRKHPRSRFVQNPIRSLCSLMFIMNARPLWASWVDPDTPVKFRSTLPLTKTDQREYTLVRLGNPKRFSCRFAPFLRFMYYSGFF